MSKPDKNITDKKSEKQCFGLYCLKTRKSSELNLSRFHRWSIYLIGILESITFSACALGWIPLVYVLKNEEVFLNLCLNSSEINSTHNELGLLSMKNETLNEKDLKLVGCAEQDKEFARVFTITVVAYGSSSVFAGMMLHHLGLVITRIVASLLIISGFACLGSVTLNSTIWLYFAMILLAVGGTTIRMAGYQFCNLFPKYRSTALSVLSGSYPASAGLFLIFQIGQINGLSLRFMSFNFAGLSFAILFFTLFMPWNNVGHNEPGISDQKETNTKIPLIKSILSLSSVSYFIWRTAHINAMSFYSLYFNPWISKIAKTNDEAGHYTMLFSISGFGCILTSPLTGILNDYLLQRAEKASKPEERMLRKLKSPFMPLAITSLLNIGLMSSLMFNDPIAIYSSFSILLFLRTFIIAVGNTFIRLRFPAYHFDILVGIFSTASTVFGLLNYPFFIWTQKHFLIAMLFLLTVLILSFLHPLHLLINKYMKNVVKEKLSSNTTKEIKTKL